MSLIHWALSLQPVLSCNSQAQLLSPSCGVCVCVNTPWCFTCILCCLCCIWTPCGAAPPQAFRKSEAESKTTEQYEVRWKIDSDATGAHHGGKVRPLAPSTAPGVVCVAGLQCCDGVRMQTPSHAVSSKFGSVIARRGTSPRPAPRACPWLALAALLVALLQALQREHPNDDGELQCPSGGACFCEMHEQSTHELW